MIFLSSGVLTTVQDFGILNLRSDGIGTSGVMDKTSMRLLNVLLNNPENCEVLEMHYPAPTITFEESALIALGGGDFSPKINGLDLDCWKMHLVKPGDMLTFGRKVTGARMYLAVKGGFKLQATLAAKSTSSLLSFGGKRIQKGDRIDLNLLNGSLFKAVEKFKISPHTVCGSLRPCLSAEQELRVIPNDSLDGLDSESLTKIFGQEFIISANSNRMGYRLEGEKIEVDGLTEQISSSVAFGTIQLLHDGSIVVLMADHQTTGGYPRLGQVISVDLPILAQLSIGQHISFKEVSISVAEEVYLKQEKEIKKLKTSVSLYK